MVCDYEYDEESQRMKVNCLQCAYGSSIEDYDVCMASIIEKLLELKKPARIILAGRREHEYELSDSLMLLEIANVLERIERERIISLKNIVIKDCESEAPERYAALQKAVGRIKYDPIEAYKMILRETRISRVRYERETDETRKECCGHYIATLEKLAGWLEECRLIRIAKDHLTEHKDRSLYRRIFHSSVKPNFMYTRYVATPPPTAELLERYAIGETTIEIYSIPGKIRKLYHIIPPEFRLSEEEYTLLDKARQYIGRHEPREFELEPGKCERTFSASALTCFVILQRRRRAAFLIQSCRSLQTYSQGTQQGSAYLS